jgi:hypothetical protein
MSGLRKNPVDKSFIELGEHRKDIEDSAGESGAGSVHSNESKVPFAETLVPTKERGRALGNSVEVNAWEVDERTNPGYFDGRNVILMTKTYNQSEVRSGV